ncbi:LuxR C-terminal-related transcriptional regulator [Pseudonocardia sp. Cha107L01]|uniref:LuxR C-terminal-related transcriptional regulator n=1 Tax=Pseudonocardia sp. Cha107L01 TaxID=3457576 RepID=UPI00403ED077
MSGTCWPLTGRETELARAINTLRDDGGVVLAGAAGVGRSRLAREILRDAGRRGRSGHWIGATAAARGIPFGAFAVLLGGADGSVEVPSLAQAAAALRDEAAVLVVDDAHLLDDASAALLHTLAIERSIALVVTVRTGELASDAVTALWKDDLLGRLELAPLGEADTATLLQTVLGGPLDAASARRLHAATVGNVLWLRHLVHGERAAGRLIERVGQWRWPGEPEITPVLADLVETRFGQLDAAHRLVLELLAFGGPLSAELVAGSADLASVVELAERGLVATEMSGQHVRLRLAQPLYGHAVRLRTSQLRAWRVRGLVAEALAGAAPWPGDTTRRAVLALDGDCTVEPALMTEAAARAASAADLPLANRLLRAACDGGGGFEPRLALGLLLAWMLRVDEAEAEIAEAIRIATDDEQRVRSTCARAIILFFQQNRPDEAWTLLNEVGQVGRINSAHLRGVRAAFAAAGNRLDQAEELATPILDSPDAAPFAQVWAGCALMVQHGLAGRADRIVALADRLIDVAARSPETAILGLNLRYLQVVGLGLAGLLDRATDCIESLADMSGEHAVMARDAAAGRLALDRGQVRTAARLFEGSRALRANDGGAWTPVFETAIALARGMAGDALGAREALCSAEEFDHPCVRLHEPELALARSWVSAAEGAVGEAIAHAEHAAELAASCGQFAVEVLARHASVCFGATDQADRLAALAATVAGPRASAAAEHADALAADDPDALLAVSAELERHDLLLPAADAAAQAAVRFRARGATTQAAFAAARASGLAQHCDCARTPALLAGVAPLQISSREREVATLAATGLSNRDIAGRLYVSVRTVEGHVYRACTRLGLTDRAALAALVSDSSTPIGRGTGRVTGRVDWSGELVRPR